MTGKNQITIPAELVREFDIAPGTRLDWAKGGKGILIVKIVPNRAEGNGNRPSRSAEPIVWQVEAH